MKKVLYSPPLAIIVMLCLSVWPLSKILEAMLKPDPVSLQPEILKQRTEECIYFFLFSVACQCKFTPVP